MSVSAIVSSLPTAHEAAMNAASPLGGTNAAEGVQLHVTGGNDAFEASSTTLAPAVADFATSAASSMRYL